MTLLNYRRDGTPFWNQFFVAALRDADGTVVNYVGVQCEVNEVPVEEIKEQRTDFEVGLKVLSQN